MSTWLSRCFKLPACLIVAILTGLAFPAYAIETDIISRREAARFGLTRAWFTQVDLDRSRARVSHITQHRDMLYVQTTDAVLHAIEAETGRTRWMIQVGRRNHPSLAPAANDKYVAVVNGSWLYVIEAATGRQLWTKQLGGGPGAGPALSDDRVFAPMINGRIEAHELEDPKAPAWMYWSAGRALVQPRTTKQSVSWPTDIGYFYVGRVQDPGVRFRVETSDSIETPPAYRRPYLYTVSLDGYAYAVHEVNGRQIWKFSAGEPIEEAPVAIGDVVYVCALRSGMYCLDGMSGQIVWFSSGAEKFLAASNNYVFAADRRGRLLILDVKTGGRLAEMPIHGMNLTQVNDQTDRVYLASDTGLLQCVHDAALATPLYHNIDTEDEAAETEDAEKPADDPAQPAGADAPDPFDKPDPEPDPEPKPEPEPEPADDPFGGGANPFGGDGAPPADDAGGNPFGGPAAPADDDDDDVPSDPFAP